MSALRHKRSLGEHGACASPPQIGNRDHIHVRPDKGHLMTQSISRSKKDLRPDKLTEQLLVVAMPGVRFAAYSYTLAVFEHERHAALLECCA
jgi:hypothetical protein